jgi:ABC-type Na+ efflux pump permease subunit
LNKLLLVCRRDYREMISTAAFRIMLIVAAVITIAAAAGISIALRLSEWYGATEAFPVAEFIVGLVVYFITLAILLAFTWGFSGLQITKEKVDGIIECLMATPLGPVTLWLGKCLAVFTPGFIISIASVVIVLLTVNLAAVLPGWGTFILPGASLVVGLIGNPLLFLAVLGFAGNPDVAIAPSFLIGFGLMIGVPAGMATGIIDITSWSFVLWYTAGAAVISIIVLLMTRMLTRQNIVLSSKGS